MKAPSAATLAATRTQLTAPALVNRKKLRIVTPPTSMPLATRGGTEVRLPT